MISSPGHKIQDLTFIENLDEQFHYVKRHLALFEQMLNSRLAHKACSVPGNIKLVYQDTTGATVEMLLIIGPRQNEQNQEESESQSPSSSEDNSQSSNAEASTGEPNVQVTPESEPEAPVASDQQQPGPEHDRADPEGLGTEEISRTGTVPADGSGGTPGTS